MSRLKSTLAAVVLSTALTGGAVSLGAVTTMTTANAAASVSTALPTLTGHKCLFTNKHWNVRKGKRVNRTTVKINHVTGHVKFRHARGCLKVKKWSN